MYVGTSMLVYTVRFTLDRTPTKNKNEIHSLHSNVTTQVFCVVSFLFSFKRFHFISILFLYFLVEFHFEQNNLIADVDFF